MVKHKSKIKKFLLLLISGILFLSTIAACSSSGGSDGGSNRSQPISVIAYVGPSIKTQSKECHTSALQAVGGMLMALIGLSKLLK